MNFVISEDNVKIGVGDLAYNYYDMQPGRIERLEEKHQVGQEGDDKHGLWFEFRHDDGSVALLNGQRICSMDYAVKREFRGAYIEPNINELFNKLHKALVDESDRTGDQRVMMFANTIDEVHHDYHINREEV